MAPPAKPVAPVTSTRIAGTMPPPRAPGNDRGSAHASADAPGDV